MPDEVMYDCTAFHRPTEERSPTSSGPSPQSERETQEEILKPLRDPNWALTEAMRNIENSDW